MAGRRPWRRLLPLVLATAATQASIVVLAPLVVEIGRDLGGSVSAVGLARSVLAGTAVAVSLAIGPVDRPDRGPAADRARGGNRGRGRRADRGGALAGALLRGSRRDRRGRGLPALGRVRRRGGVVRRRRGALGDGLGGGRAVAGVDRGQPDHRPAGRRGLVAALLLVPGAISLLALAAGLAAPRAAGHGGGRGRGCARSGRGSAPSFETPRPGAGPFAELVAYCAWTAELTYAGAFYIETYDVVRGRHRTAAGDGLGGVPDHVAEHRAPHRPLPHPAADRDRPRSGWR